MRESPHLTNADYILLYMNLNRMLQILQLIQKL